jgi:hypothetical protein
MVMQRFLALEQRLLADEQRIEAYETVTLIEIPSIKRQLEAVHGLLVNLTNRTLLPPMRPPEDSISADIDQVRKSVAPQRQQMAQKLATRTDPEVIERDLEGFERTVLRSFATWRRIGKWTGWMLAGLGVLGHLAWEIYQASHGGR